MNYVKKLLAISLVLALAAVSQGQTYKVLHTFTGADGMNPSGGLIFNGTTCFGSAGGGGIGEGTLFSMQTDGSFFNVIHQFAAGSADGARPAGNLTLIGSTLYGTSELGGLGYGTVFSIGLNGQNMNLMHSFSTSEGFWPLGQLARSGSYLYGTAIEGGTGAEYGSVFRIGLDGSGYAPLHNFPSSSTTGLYPEPNLVISGSTIYGVTQSSWSGPGVIFKMNLDGSGYSVVRNLDGIGGAAHLLLSGSTLYGSDRNGELFKMNTDGTGYSVLRTFSGGNYPCGDMVLLGSVLYGTAAGGSGNGTLFQINTNGTGFKVLHGFAGGTDGVMPWGGVALNGSTLYGMTVNGGGSANNGVIYSMAIPEPSTFALLGMGAIALLAGVWRRRRG
jgi:uncharacterized repeat protein (TIGR03803 family)